MVARIPDGVVREIVDRSDMAAVVGDVIKLARSGNSLRGLCPFHGEKTPSFYVNPHTKLYFCHGCGAGGDVIRFVSEMRGLSFSESVEWLGDRCGIRIEREELDPVEARRRANERSERGRLLELNEAANRYFVDTLRRSDGAAALAYAEHRGLGPEIIERFGVGAAPDGWDGLSSALLRHGFSEDELCQVGLSMQRRSGDGVIDRFRNRLMYPVHASSGDMVAFGGRDLSDRKDVAKYMNSPESELRSLDATQNHGLWKFFKKSKVVYGLWLARGGIRREGYALLVEGNLDVMTLHQAGLDNTVAPMGTALAGTQLAELRRFTDRVVLCFDGDKPGRAAAQKSIPLALAAGLDGKVVMLPAGEDPDSFVRHQGAAALRTLIDDADDMVTAFIDAAIAGWDGTIHGRLEVAGDVQAVLTTIPDPMAREMARDTLAARLFGGDVTLGRRTLDRMTRRPGPAIVKSDDDGPMQPALPAEPPMPQLELELAEVAMWRPELLLELERVGALDFVGHPGLRLALGTLCTLAQKAGAIDLHQLRAWISELTESYSKQALMRALVESPRVEEVDLELHVESILDSLEIAALERARSELEARGARAGDAETMMAVFEMRSRIEALRSKRRTTTAGKQGTGGAAARRSPVAAGLAGGDGAGPRPGVDFGAKERRDGAFTS